MQTQHRLPLAGFPILEFLGQFKYPDGSFSGELYQICGRIYRPLARSFPPLRGALLDNRLHSCVSKSEISLNRSVISHASHYTASCDQGHTGTATQTLVCCSVIPLAIHDHLGMVRHLILPHSRSCWVLMDVAMCSFMTLLAEA